MEGGYVEYQLLHEDVRSVRREAILIAILAVVVLALLGTACGFDIMEVDVERGGSNRTVSSPLFTAPPPAVVPHADRLAVFVFWRCVRRIDSATGAELQPKHCKLVIFGDACPLESALMYIVASCAAAGIACAILTLMVAVTEVCRRRPLFNILWASSVSLVLTTVAAATCAVIAVSADSALCSTGSHDPAASLPGFRFGDAFWLLVAAPVVSTGLMALALQSC